MAVEWIERLGLADARREAEAQRQRRDVAVADGDVEEIERVNSVLGALAARIGALSKRG